MGKISGSHCLVMGCRNRQLLNQTNSRSYFRFPRDPDMCKQWVDFCNRPELWKKYDENGPEYLYKSSRICSDHFQSSDFNNPNLFSQGLKKGSVPTLYPASKEPKNRYSIGAISGVSGIGLTGGSVASGGGGGGGGSSSPPTNNSNSNHSDSDSLALPMPTKRPLLSQPSAQQPVAKQRRLLPPALSTAVNTASVSGALAGLIQRQQLKEQQRKAMAAALQLHQRQHAQTQQAARTLLESLKLRPNPNNNNHISSNNNNNNNSHNNNNNNNNSKNSSSKSAAASPGKYEDEQGYGINYVDMDGGDSSEYDSSYQNSIDEEISAYKHMQQMKAIKAAAAVIPASLQGELTVTPAVMHTSSSTSGININNNNNHSNTKPSSNSNSVNTSSSTNGTINYKEKYEQTLKELFACRKIVKNQNNAIRQLQTEIDFLTQLLKEK